MQSWLRLAALAAIRGYQRFLSPRKGFSCAWRVHTGGASCSALGYRVIRRHGLWRGLELLRERTYRCGAAQHRCGHASQPGISVLVSQRGHCDIGSCDLPDCSGLPSCHLPNPCDSGITDCCDPLSNCCDIAGGCDGPSLRRGRRADKMQYVHIPPKRRGRSKPEVTTGPTPS